MTIVKEAQAGTAKKAPFNGAFFIVRMILVSLCMVLNLSACAKDPYRVTVKKVIDGDTVRLEGGETVRLLGLNAPEKEFDDRPAQPLSLEATLLLKELVEGQSVWLTKGRIKKDKYKRTLGYLDLPDGTDVQRQLIARGYAFVVAFPPDIDRLDLYREAERKARKAEKGIWGLAIYKPVQQGQHKRLKSGFGQVSGEITKVRFSKKNVRLFIGDHMVIGIRHTEWEKFWSENAKTLAGKTVVARGWIQAMRKNNPAYLRVRHPAMMEIK